MPLSQNPSSRGSTASDPSEADGAASPHDPEIEETRPDLVIVGGGMSAHHLVEQLIELGATQRWRVTLLSEELHAPYDRVHLGTVVEGADPRSLELRGADWYAANGIELRLKERVVGIDRERRRIQTASGVELPYARLVLATGGSPLVPPVPGATLEGVVAYRNLEDAEAIARSARQAARIVIVGGGLLGIEAAHMLAGRGCHVDVIEMAPRLLPRQLDAEGAALLEAQIRRQGIGLRLNTRLMGISQAEEGLRVEVADAETRTLRAELVILAVGIRPHDALAREAGLDCDRSGGVVVVDDLSTSDPSIDAIGECTRHRGTLQGFVAPCHVMADVLADRLGGGQATFTGATPSARLKIEGIDVATVGDSLDEGVGVEALEWSDASAYRRLVLRDGHLIGTIAVGETPDLPRLQEAIARRARLPEWQRRRFLDRGTLFRSGARTSVAGWPANAIVCTCTGVTRGRLTAARAAGHRTSIALREYTGAGSVCGSCRPLVEELAGETNVGRREGAGRGLLAVGALGIAGLVAAAMLSPIQMATSVVDGASLDFLWRDGDWKQTTGFTLLGLTAASLLLSLNKRAPKLPLGRFTAWRMLHSVLGVATILGVGVHTGYRPGSNLNFVLMSCFAVVLLLGAGTAIVTSLEHRLPGTWGSVLRRGWTLAHIVAFAPLPVLIAFHVLSVYYY